MPHRDDLEAAHSRIAALQRELAAARNEGRNRFRCGRCREPYSPGDLDQATGTLTCRACRAAVDADRPPRIPIGFEVEDLPDRLRITWGWRISVRESFGLLIMIALLILVAVNGRAGDPRLLLPCIILGASAVLLAFRLVRQFLNRTVIEVTGDQLAIHVSPVPLGTLPRLSRREIDQLFCVAYGGRHGTWYALHAQLVGGRRIRLVAEIAEAERAFFLERAIEQRLGIADRPVAGEVPRRP